MGGPTGNPPQVLQCYTTPHGRLQVKPNGAPPQARSLLALRIARQQTGHRFLWRHQTR
jgi:hypothetical protein